MQRRQFIRLIGGGTVAAATAATTGAAQATSWFSGALPEEALAAWQGPATGIDPLRWALAHAITAPNPHNLQPWLVDLREEGAITVFTDPERVLPETDPLGRQILIGHGAFLELLVMALAERGIAAQVQLWPQGELSASLRQWDKRPVARLALSASPPPKDPLFAQILNRSTPKTDFDTTKPVSQATLDALLKTSEASATANGMLLAGTVEPSRLSELRQLCLDAALVEVRTDRTMLESLRLIRVGPKEILQHRDGISINSPFVRALTAMGLFDRSQAPKPGSAGDKGAVDRFTGHSLTAMGFVWLGGPNTRSAQINAGRAYVRLQLEATALGVGVHPMSQALQEFAEMAPHYAKAHQLTLGKPAPQRASEDTLQMFCRLGYASERSRSPRRELGKFVV